MGLACSQCTLCLMACAVVAPLPVPSRAVTAKPKAKVSRMDVLRRVSLAHSSAASESELCAIRACRGSHAAVIQTNPTHAELYPSSVRLLSAGGAECITIITLEAWVGTEFGIFESMREHMPRFYVLRGAHALNKYMWTIVPKMVFLQTFENSGRAHVHITALLASLPWDMRVLAGCHNVGPCSGELNLTRGAHPSLHVTLIATTPEMQRRLQGIGASPPILHMPAYLLPMPRSPQQEAAGITNAQRRDILSRSRSTQVRILVAGKFSRSKKDYDAVLATATAASRNTIEARRRRSSDDAHATAPISIHFIFFGGCRAACRAAEQRLKRRLNELAPPRTVTTEFLAGSFRTLFAQAHSADFVAPLLHEWHCPPPCHGMVARGYPEGKLTSSIAIALA